MKRIAAALGAVVFLGAVALPAAAKKKDKSNPAAIALFEKAIAASDIEAKGAPAFRLQATVRIFGANNHNSAGVLVEFWAPGGERREETMLPGYELVRVSDGRRLWAKGALNYVPYPIHALWASLAFPGRLRRWISSTGDKQDAETWIAWQRFVMGPGGSRPGNGQRNLAKPWKKAGEECVKARIEHSHEEEFCFDAANGDLAAALGGRLPLLIDGGVRRGADVIKARALGAQAVAIGRPTLYGATAAGESGARRALEILTDEIERTLKLCGARTLAEVGPDLLAGLPRPHKTAQHLPDFDGARAGRHHRIVCGECPQLLFVVGLHHAKAPRAGAVEHGTEDHHLARLDPGPPMGGMAGHDLSFLVAHVQRERRAGRVEPEYERAHEPRIPAPCTGPIPAHPAMAQPRPGDGTRPCTPGDRAASRLRPAGPALPAGQGGCAGRPGRSATVQIRRSTSHSDPWLAPSKPAPTARAVRTRSTATGAAPWRPAW